MDRLWTPWRYAYVTQAGREDSPCILCSVSQACDDAAHLIFYRGSNCFALLNLFPYTSGHVMVVPYRHIPLLSDATPDELHEMMLVIQRAQHALGELYRPDGYNLGMNLGASAGAGVAGHIHMHLLPRWNGDTNFMSVVAETRILPESLQQTYWKIKPFFHAYHP